MLPIRAIAYTVCRCGLLATALAGSGALVTRASRDAAARATKVTIEAHAGAARQGGVEAVRAQVARELELATLLVERTSFQERRVSLGAPDRVAVGQARITLSASQRLFDDGLFEAAGRRATEASALASNAQAGVHQVTSRYNDPTRIAEWQRWVQETRDWSRQQARPAIVVSKAAHRVTLYDGGRVVRTYYGDLGVNWAADKRRAGDGATPEGRYKVIEVKTMSSAYHKALLVDYPNERDRGAFAEAMRTGQLPPSARVGGQIEIHGEGGSGEDWTDGCIALANVDMDDLIRRVEVGTPVTIVGATDFGEMAGRLTGPAPIGGVAD